MTENEKHSVAPLSKTSNAPSNILKFGNFAEAMQAAKLLASSALVPDVYRGKPADVLVCWQYGAEVGLHPMQSLQSIAVINGKPGLYGDGLLAICQAHPDWVDMIETFDGKKATCLVKRRGCANMSRSFSIEEASVAGLLQKKGPWQQYRDRMLQMRARGFALRDAFADALKGFKSVEELQDYPNARASVMPSAEESAQGNDSIGVGNNVAIESQLTEENQEQQKRIPCHSQTLQLMLTEIEVSETIADLQSIRPAGDLTSGDREVAQVAWRNRRAKIEAEAEVAWRKARSKNEANTIKGKTQTDPLEILDNPSKQAFGWDS